MELSEAKERELTTNLARDKAEALLEGLRRAKAEAEADQDRLAQLSPEQIQQGRMAMDNAIASAERMVESLNAALDLARSQAAEADQKQA
jgi:hypothetical protein